MSLIGTGVDARLAGEHMLGAAREHHHVAGFEGDRRNACPSSAQHWPCVAMWNGVTASAPGKEARGQHLGRRRQDRPGVRELGAKMDGAGEANDPQHLGQNVHQTSQDARRHRWQLLASRQRV